MTDTRGSNKVTKNAQHKNLGCWFLVNERRTEFSPLLILFQDHVGPA